MVGICGVKEKRGARDGPSAVFDVQLHFGGAAGAQRSSVACDPGDGGRALAQLGPCFDTIYTRSGRPSIAPEKLLRALLLQVL
jgi:hypothetical protein